MKATELLKKDHAAVKKLFAEIGRTSARATKSRQQLVERLVQELEIHAQIEEEIFYPAVRHSPKSENLVKEARAEHQEIKSLVGEVQGLEAGSEELMAKIKELKQAVLHHAGEEETEMFPEAEELGRERLMEVGEQLAERKQELLKSPVQRAKRAVKKAIRRVA
jgi:hemerythrin superfamily protein